MVFSNRKWISLLSDVSRLATPFPWGSRSATFSTNVTGLKQHVEKESTLQCCQDELHLQAGEYRLCLKTLVDSKDMATNLLMKP